ncbi:DUF2059 domain-containing protein [Sphingobium sp. SYK-6]|uniref:DUF2059 domain-containing protein n=1 Tax=Sphingobium sp. (strain NBRC 103272 / SYK-6) TaxID=627192 RepID=UPI001314603C|nr:DUF2059 domain-containing protein [Sphingobium sp. SYK-6]
MLLPSPAVIAAEQSVAPATSAAPEPARLESARRLVDVILPAEQRDAMFASAVNAMMDNMLAGVVDGQEGFGKMLAETPELRTAFANFVERQRALAHEDLRETTPELILAYTNAYARLFTTGELDEIAAFMTTPAGRAYAQRSSEIMSDPDFAAWQRNVSARSQARLTDELGKLMQEIKPIIEAKEATHHGS